jgi:aspartyl protease family protein
MLKAVLFLAGLALAIALTAPDYVMRLLDRVQDSAVARPSGAPPPAVASADHGGIVRIPADPSGHYVSDIEVNGRTLNAVVDTGATLVILRYEDARALGVVFPGDRFDIEVRTANGTGHARRVELRSVRVGPIAIQDVDALVMEEGALKMSNLLGMSFLKRLSRFEAQRGMLVLER